MEGAPNQTPIEHQDVPAAHQGLHDFLYSSADEHGVEQNSGNGAMIDDAAIVPLDHWCDRVGDVKVAGVYAVFDRHQNLQYVNISRHVSLALRGHQTQLGIDLCAFVRVQPFGFPKREAMMAVQADWIEANGGMPIGNQDTEGLWAKTTGDAAIAAMSPAERAAYEEKKLKLRKAMADSTLNPDLPAVAQGDDWSSVIQSQTQDTI